MLVLDGREVAERLDRRALIDALEHAFRGNIQAPLRENYRLDDNSGNQRVLLVMPAWHSAGRIGVKLTTICPANASKGYPVVQATYTVFDAVTGVPLAVLDGTELTRRRTAAASALAARYLAGRDASRLLVVGTGALVPHLIESHALVSPIDSVRVWGRSTEAARAVASAFAGRFRIEVAEDLQSAVRWADVISCATSSENPLVHGEWLRPGQHLDLVGAFTAGMREADDTALARAEIFVDTRSGALAESGELLHAIAAGVITAKAIRAELAELTRGTFAGRRSSGQITLFKSVGCALEDLAAAELALGLAGT